MNSNPNSQYIIIKSNGNIVNYYFHSDFGICSSSLSPLKKWNNAVSDAEDAIKDYSINLDSQNTVYLIYRNISGVIKVLIDGGMQTKTINVLQCKINPDYNMFPAVVPHGNILNAVYIIEKSGRKILCHQRVKNGKPDTPSAIDYINYNEEIAPYSLTYSKKGKIYLLYNTFVESKNTAGIRIYDKKSGKWGKFISLEKPGQLIHRPVISSYNNRVIIAYVKTYDDATYIVKRNFNGISLTLTPEQEIVNLSQKDVRPQIYMTEDTDYIYWNEGRQIRYYSQTKNADNSSVKSLDFNEKGNVLHFNVIANKNDSIIHASDLPGNFNNGLTLGFMELPIQNRKVHSFENSDSSSKEKTEIDFVFDKIRELERKIKVLSEKVTAMEKNQ